MMKPGILMGASCVVLELLAEELTSVSEMQFFFIGACHDVIHCRILISSDFLKKRKPHGTKQKKITLQRTKESATLHHVKRRCLG